MDWLHLFACLVTEVYDAETLSLERCGAMGNVPDATRLGSTWYFSEHRGQALLTWLQV